ncbi:hypothetical protein B0H17DRAFT_1142824 [Mycena rosella]|uniref:DUF6589 domain-containing protein n=1 Tax=Mycena rosella TaxID=1033263 RepID=A0AAD7G908_MYCRO|nr:hypothetical protein B0H17DRAFT_1142824 [Mycena rosella]
MPRSTQNTSKTSLPSNTQPNSSKSHAALPASQLPPSRASILARHSGFFDANLRSQEPQTCQDLSPFFQHSTQIDRDYSAFAPSPESFSPFAPPPHTDFYAGDSDRIDPSMLRFDDGLPLLTSTPSRLRHAVSLPSLAPDDLRAQTNEMSSLLLGPECSSGFAPADRPSAFTATDEIPVFSSAPSDEISMFGAADMSVFSLDHEMSVFSDADTMSSFSLEHQMASFKLVDRAPELPCANKTSPLPSPAAHPSKLPKTTAPTFRIPAGSKTSKIDAVLQLLRDARLSPFDIIMHILDPSSGSKYRDYRSALYKDDVYRIQALLDTLLLDERSARIFTEWVKPHAVDVVCDSMAEEMTVLTRALGTAPSVKALTPAYLRGWSLEKCVAGPAKSIAPTVVRALHTCLNTKEGLAKNKKKKNDTALYTIIAQLASRRSQASSDFSGPMSLFWWQSGCTREAMEALQSIGLSKCFDTTQDLIESLANYCIADACVLARAPEGSMVNWDNINMSTSIFVEQRNSAPAKVQSGTYTILYRLHNPNPSAMRLAPLLARAESATDLDFNFDVCPTLEQSLAAHSQFRAYAVRVLHRYHTDFESLESDPLLQNHPRRPLPAVAWLAASSLSYIWVFCFDSHPAASPVGLSPAQRPRGVSTADYRTEQFPIRISTKEESSIPGTLAVHQDIFITQLKFTYAELTKAVLSINDQATQALNRGAMSIRAFDLTLSCARKYGNSGSGSLTFASTSSGDSPCPPWPR